MKYYAITCIRGHQGARNDNALITFYVEAKDIIAAAKVAQRMGGIKHTKMPLNCKQITKEEVKKIIVSLSLIQWHILLPLPYRIH